MIHLKLDKSYLSILLFIYMLIISNIQNGILSVVAVLFCMCFVNQPQFLLPHLLLTSLFGDYFVAFSGIGMSRIVAVIFIAAVFLRRFKTDAKMDCKSLVVFLALSVFVFFSGMRSLTGSMIPAYVLILNFMIVLAMQNMSADDYDKSIELLRICILVMALDIFFLLVSGRAEYYAERLVLHSSLNSNQLGMGIVQMVVILVATLANKRVRQRKIVTFITVGFLLYVILLTGSRTSLIAVLSALGIVGIYYGVTQKKGIIKFAFIILPILLVWGIDFIIQHGDLTVFERFTVSSVLETGGTGRRAIWYCALTDVFPKYPIFGVGVGVDNTIYAMKEYLFSNNVGIHNMYITLLIQTGIVGAILFLAVIIGHFIGSLRRIRFDIRMLMPALMLAAALINGIGEEVYGERFVWMAIGYFYMVINLMHEKDGVVS